MHDLYHNVAVQQALNPVNATATQTSSTIDLQGYNSATVVVALGTAGDTLSGSVFWTLTLQESSDDSSYSAVTTAGLLNGAASYVVNSSSLDKTAYNFAYIGGKRYVQAVITKTGTMTVGTPLAVIGLKGNASKKPVI